MYRVNYVLPLNSVDNIDGDTTGVLPVVTPAMRVATSSQQEKSCCSGVRILTLTAICPLPVAPV